jgi:hypothetical protein
MNGVKFIFFCLFITHVLNADITGIGFAQTLPEAKKEALADLSQVIKSEVISTFESKIKVDAQKESSTLNSNIKISSNLPILGAEFSYIDRALEVEAKVKLTPKKVKKLYIQKLKNIDAQIYSLLKELKDTKKSSLKLQIYEDMFSLISEYERYASVAIILGAESIKPLPITKAKVKLEISKLATSIDSLGMASTILAREFNDKKIYIYPPLLQGTTMVSEFGNVFLSELKSKIKSLQTPKDASSILVGRYTTTKSGLVLNYELLDIKTNEVKKSKTITIKPDAYKDIKLKPTNIEFDMLLNSGIAISSDLKVQLNSNRGSENLLFRGGDEVELFVKLNKMGYFYIVGYTQTKDKKFSYLLELQEGNGNSKFVKFVNSDDASRWISLGKFEVEEPFGVESLQVIASNKEIHSLPNVRYDEQSGYYIVSKNIKKALIKTRGLKKKHSKKTEFSEAVMSFVSVK